MAWSNVAKIDLLESKPPTDSMWKRIQDACLAALKEELECLSPRSTVLVTGGFRRADILQVLQRCGYVPQGQAGELDDCHMLQHEDGRVAAITRHPQGWRTGPGDEVAVRLRHLLRKQ